MTDPRRPSSVDEIARLVGWRAGDFRPELDWEAVERELGTPLPSDYKELLTRFPSGAFRGSIEVDNPGQSAGELASTKQNNEQLLEIFADEDTGYLTGVSYRLFPEPGGLYPWGRNDAGGTFWWITDAADPDTWRIAYNDRDHWHEHPGPMSAVVHEILASTGEDNILGWDLAGKPVEFTGFVGDRMVVHPAEPQTTP
ncbi:SMI1/KNR4 family protein [Amycolatopsis sp. NPDC089917]|uniref:SMI1/KNR4 family protein n=1 Tax=Amycolatopsis sp. NPDC089917 TaxID=3155187 RepID=UPI003439F23A